MEDKSVEQLQAETEQLKGFYQAVIEELQSQVSQQSYDLAVSRALIKNKDATVQSMLEKIEELESEIVKLKGSDD